MSGIGPMEIVLIVIALLLLFGATRLPKLARSVGQAGKEFKEGLKEGYVAQPVEGPCPFCSVDIPADSKFCPGCAKPADEIVAEREKKAKSA